MNFHLRPDHRATVLYPSLGHTSSLVPMSYVSILHAVAFVYDSEKLVVAWVQSYYGTPLLWDLLYSY